jgi:hypothetical protein
VLHLEGDGLRRKFVEQAGPDVEGFLGERHNGTQDGIDGAGQGVRIVGRDDDAALVRFHQLTRAHFVGGDDGAAEDERFHQPAGEGVEEGGNDDDTGQLDLANHFVGTDSAEIFHPRAGELDAGGFLGFFPALDEAPIVFGEIADDREG